MKKFLLGFINAFKGVFRAFSERNMKFHAVMAFLVITFAFILKISLVEWFIVIILISAVISAELFNTALESICNKLRDDLGLSYLATQKARDVAAGAVFVLSIGAAITGLLIFLPKIIDSVAIEIYNGY